MAKKLLLTILPLAVIDHLIAALVVDLRRPAPIEKRVAAVDSGDAAAVAKYVQSGARLDAAKGELFPIHLAASKGRVDIMKLLTAAGAKVNAQDISSDTALHRVAGTKQPEAIQIALAHALPSTNVVNIEAAWFRAHRIFLMKSSACFRLGLRSARRKAPAGFPSMCIFHALPGLTDCENRRIL